MHLEKLTIELKRYGEHAGKYIAAVTVADNESTIIMQLSPEMSNIVLRECIGELCRATDDAAKEMKERLLAAQPAAITDTAQRVPTDEKA